MGFISDFEKVIIIKNVCEAEITKDSFARIKLAENSKTLPSKRGVLMILNH